MNRRVKRLLYLERARMSYALGRKLTQPLRDINKAVRFSSTTSETAEALRIKALILSALRRDRESTRCLKQALRLKPRDPAILADLGSNLVILGKAQEALPLLDKALRVFARRRESQKVDLVFAIDCKAEALNALGKHEEALELARTALKKARDKESKMILRTSIARTRQFLQR